MDCISKSYASAYNFQIVIDMDKKEDIGKKLLSSDEMTDYQPKFDKNYLDSLIEKAKENWKDIDADEFLNQLRGDYEA